MADEDRTRSARPDPDAPAGHRPPARDVGHPEPIDPPDDEFTPDGRFEAL